MKKMVLEEALLLYYCHHDFDDVGIFTDVLTMVLASSHAISWAGSTIGS